MKKLALFLALIIITVCFYSPSSVYAKKYDVETNHKEYINPKYKTSNFAIYYTPAGTVIKNLKIKNKKVVEFDNEYGGDGTPVYYHSEYKSIYIGLIIKSEGTTYVTGDIYLNNKFIKSFKTKVSFYKYNNPFKKIKVNKKNITKKFKKVDSIDVKIKLKKKYKLSLKLKKGWKIKMIEFQKGNKSKNIKKKKKFTVTNVKKQSIWITLKNKKFKNDEFYYICFK